MSRIKYAGIAAAVTALTLSVADTAWAQRALEFAPSVPNIMVDVDGNGTPIIMKGLRSRPKKPESKKPESEDVDRPSKQVERPRMAPRGSSAYVAPTPLPNTARSSGIAAPPPVTPYNPPAINNPSERINQLNQSFPLNGGLGNNPTNRDAYIRYNLNR